MPNLNKDPVQIYVEPVHADPVVEMSAPIVSHPEPVGEPTPEPTEEEPTPEPTEEEPTPEPTEE